MTIFSFGGTTLISTMPLLRNHPQHLPVLSQTPLTPETALQFTAELQGRFSIP